MVSGPLQNSLLPTLTEDCPQLSKLVLGALVNLPILSLESTAFAYRKNPLNLSPFPPAIVTATVDLPSLSLLAGEAVILKGDLLVWALLELCFGMWAEHLGEPEGYCWE